MPNPTATKNKERAVKVVDRILIDEALFYSGFRHHSRAVAEHIIRNLRKAGVIRRWEK